MEKNLISISGSAGHGKDTVARIIQWLLSGNVGQVSVEDISNTKHHDWWLEEQSGFEIKKFAGKLKEIASILTGVPIEKWEDQDFKKKTFKQLVEEGYISQELLNTLTKP